MTSAEREKLRLTNTTRAWSEKRGEVKMATWNCFGLTLERVEYLFGAEGQPESGLFPAKGPDWLVGLIECRGGEQRLDEFFGRSRLVVSDPPPNTDRAFGVAIVMSPRLGRTVVDRGHSGSRIVWVQLETAAHGWDVIVVNVYVPHHGRVQPSADDTFGELGRLFADFEADPRKRRACKVLMGDMNSRLARAYDYTGRKRVVCDEERVEVTGCWSVHHSDNEMGGKLRQLLLDHELFS
eukprot:SAG11_NODE_9934_length_868_cov_3.729519_1_plen_237_part_10